MTHIPLFLLLVERLAPTLNTYQSYPRFEFSRSILILLSRSQLLIYSKTFTRYWETRAFCFAKRSLRYPAYLTNHVWNICSDRYRSRK